MCGVSDESLRPICAEALQSLSQHGSSQLKEHAADAASLAFFAMHRQKTPETEAEIGRWEEVWSELSPGTEGGLRLYLVDIVPLCRAALAGQSWPVKAQAAATLGAAAARLSAGLPTDQLQAVLDALLAALPGRTWDGKHALLTALADVCQNCAAAVPDGDRLADAVLTEAARDKPEYKVHAVAAAGRVLRDLRLDRFGRLLQLVEPYLQVGGRGSETVPRQTSRGGYCALNGGEGRWTWIAEGWNNRHYTAAGMN